MKFTSHFLLLLLLALFSTGGMAQSKKHPKFRTSIPRDSIRLSDPCILADDATRTYYMTGTGGLLWKSKNLDKWDGPYIVAETDSTSWMGSNPQIWAAELHKYNGKYYYFATFTNNSTLIGNYRGNDIPRRACHVLVSDKPDGPYRPMKDPTYLPESVPTLDGTLWVDKNLRMQGLLQAFSRTNRILNSVKAFGNIICFRKLEEATNKCLALFGDKEAGGIVLMKTFNEYYNGYTDDKGRKFKGYKELIDELLSKFPAGEVIVSEKEAREFVKLYSAILRLKNILSSFDEFTDKEILSEREVQDYQSQYLDIRDKFVSPQKEKDNINDDLVF